MILCDKSIRKSLKEGVIKIEPLNEGNIQPASVDLRLGKDFSLLKYWSGVRTLDLKSPNVEHEKITNQKEMVIPPHSFILGTTEESIELPSHISAFVEGRSSIGRIGLFIQTAGLVAAGFKGQITLELYNANNLPIVVQAGHRICQIVFFEMTEAAANAYQGKYQNQKGVVSSKVSQDMENE